MTYFKTISPQGDGNHDRPNAAPQPIISKPYPRKGTETEVFFVDAPAILLISKPYPRKGTETLIMLLFFMMNPPYFKTISPQGDGNITNVTLSAKKVNNFKTISPQGDGNLTVIAIPRCAFNISKPYPRKGTETPPRFLRSLISSLFQNHIPARGRKPCRVWYG